MSLADLSRTPSAPDRPSPDAVLAEARRLQAETYATWMRKLYRAIAGLVCGPTRGGPTHSSGGAAVPPGRPPTRFRTRPA